MHLNLIKRKQFQDGSYGNTIYKAMHYKLQKRIYLNISKKNKTLITKMPREATINIDNKMTAVFLHSSEQRTRRGEGKYTQFYPQISLTLATCLVRALIQQHVRGSTSQYAFLPLPPNLLNIKHLIDRSPLSEH